MPVKPVMKTMTIYDGRLVHFLAQALFNCQALVSGKQIMIIHQLVVQS